MTIAIVDTLPAEIVRGRRGGGPAPTRTTVAYGFWIFILSDIVMFSALFAAYAVLSGNTAGGPTARNLFNLHNVFVETACLLFSSYTCGLGMLSAERRQPARFLLFAAFTFALGAAFLTVEIPSLPGWSGPAPGRRAAPSCPASLPLSACTAPMSRRASFGSPIRSPRSL
jgi:cytochrome o ubiquinol oxidase subunit 3